MTVLCVIGMWPTEDAKRGERAQTRTSVIHYIRYGELPTCSRQMPSTHNTSQSIQCLRHVDIGALFTFRTMPVGWPLSVHVKPYSKVKLTHYTDAIVHVVGH